jgi:RimJ/RimL family protein N-acetyltransferase
MPQKNEGMAQIRKARIEDAAGLVNLFSQLDEETAFMLFEPRERTITVEQQTNRLKAFENSSTDIMLVAEDNRSIIGFVVGIGGSANRNRHSLHIVIGVLRAYWGLGIGRGLIESLESWAKDKSLHRLELTVMVHNERAIALYEKCGFAREGIKRDALRVEGKYVNEIYMSKLI